jgi:hypothetical protein
MMNISTYQLTLNGIINYFVDTLLSSGDGYIYLQSHRGSGVIFTADTHISRLD